MPDLEIWLFSAAFAVLFSASLFFAAAPLMGVLQQEGYRGRDLLKFLCAKNNMLRRRYALLGLCVALSGALLPLCFSFAGESFAVCAGAVGFVGFCALFAFAGGKSLKVPLVRTHRAVRLSVSYFLMETVLLFGAEVGLGVAASKVADPLGATMVRTLPPALFVPLSVLVLVAANFVMKGYEIPHTARLVCRAKTTISASPCVKVGITGSFGKTSVKHFAAQILSAHMRVAATPASFNTPAGIAKYVNENGLDCDVFLAEMGARHRGDIDELVRLVSPRYAVVTGVGNQHLGTFGSLQNIIEEKGKLSAAAEISVLGESAKDLPARRALSEGRDFSAENIVLSRDGVSFDLVLAGERYPVSCPLYGRHVANDVALAAALATLFGMTGEEIAAQIPNLKPVPHRLERMDRGGVVILDDSFNANAEGAKNAVETLNLFGGSKYIVTPGLVELGEAEEGENAALGALLCGLEVVLVGETRVLSVRAGYLEAGGDAEHLRIVPTLAAAQEILAKELKAGDCVLFLNDLPDKYVG